VTLLLLLLLLLLLAVACHRHVSRLLHCSSFQSIFHQLRLSLSLSLLPARASNINPTRQSTRVQRCSTNV